MFFLLVCIINFSQNGCNKSSKIFAKMFSITWANTYQQLYERIFTILLIRFRFKWCLAYMQLELLLGWFQGKWCGLRNLTWIQNNLYKILNNKVFVLFVAIYTFHLGVEEMKVVKVLKLTFILEEKVDQNGIFWN